MQNVIRGIYAAISQFGAGFLAISAFLLSLYNLYDSKRTQDLVSRTEAIKIEYGIYTDLTKLEHDNPFLAHLFSPTPATYFFTSTRIKTATKDLQPKDRISLLLQERAIAHYIFTVYEETYYQWQSARDADNDMLAQLLLNDLIFFNDILCNSRLIWHWDNSDDPLYKQFSRQLVSYYTQNVKTGCRATPDPAGPLGSSAS